MKSFFSLLTRLSLHFRAVTLVLVIVFSVLGVIAITQLPQELLPSIAFPQTVILTQVSGMTSEEVLNVLTRRLETALDQVEPIVNLESTTTGAFGSVIIARNNFGLDQQAVVRDIQAAMDSVWLPQRRIQPPAGQNAQDFAVALLGDLTPEVLIYLQEKDSNFLFQLSPEVWSALSDDTVRTVLAYLSAQTKAESADRSALHSLVDKEIVPQLQSLDVVANVLVTGGQALPGEATAAAVAASGSAAPESLLLQLSPQVWQVVSAKVAGLGTQDEQAVEALQQTSVEIPADPPPLPTSWQMDRFFDASDLAEIGTLTHSTAANLNDFYQTGHIVGALGQTNDLTPEDVTQMLAIAPSLVNYLEAEHLAALSPAVFAVLPADFIAGLDGFTRDELAAAALAKKITAKEVAPEPVKLPSAWRISAPQIRTFSFDDIPLASFSVFSTGSVPAAAPTAEPADQQGSSTAADNPNKIDTPAVEQSIPEGPALPSGFSQLGLLFVGDLNTADDLFKVELAPLVAQFSGGNTAIDPATVFNTLFMVDNLDPSALPAAVRLVIPLIQNSLDANALIHSVSADAIDFIAQHDPTFLPNLSAEVYEAFSDEVFQKDPQAAPLLDNAWDALAKRPEFKDNPLHSAADLIHLGNGKASTILNTINTSVPEGFAGYEVRLFDSLTPATIRYLALQEPDFYQNLDANVLTKLSPAVLAQLPGAVLRAQDENTTATLQAIASGEQQSAAQTLASQYTSNLPPADPNAPPLGPDWQFVGDFIGIELDSADDLFRFPDIIKTASTFMNGFFDSANGRSFAPKLFGSLTIEDINYVVSHEPDFLDKLSSEALLLLSEEVFKQLPQAVQARAQSGGETFTPTNAVTRTDGNSSLLVTIYKVGGANTVAAFHQAEDALRKIDEQDDSISIVTGFEQASFIQESIDGVAREGGLGGIFAVVVILVFLSAGVWPHSRRRATGLMMIALFLALLAIIVLSNLGAAEGNFSQAFEQIDVLMRALLIIAALIGLLIFLWPRNLPNPAWRSTLVVAISIPLSLLIALAFMNWVPSFVHRLLAPAAQNSGLLSFLLHLFPESVTLNIMTLSGFTVAIGRVVDDSIVVLENIFREIQAGGDKRQAIIKGTRDVSVAIFAATIITVVVFLPLGLTGGIISEFFLPFGLAVTYALMASFIVAITVVPVLTYLFISPEEATSEGHEGRLEKTYIPVLTWALASNRNKTIVLLAAAVSFVIGMALFATRPRNFLPELGEPQVSISVSLPEGTKILETNDRVLELENYLQSALPADEVKNVRTIVGSGGASLQTLLFGGSTVSENVADIAVGIRSREKLDRLAQQIRTQAEQIFGQESVKVSAASMSEQGFGSFALVLSGPQSELEAINQQVIDTLNSVPGITNATSNLAQVSAAGGEGDSVAAFIRIDSEPAVRFTAELETQDTLGVTAQAIEKIKALPDLPADIKVSQGFESQLQTEGFQSLFVAMGIAIVIVIAILMITFGSVVHWFDIILSVGVAPVGAAVLLSLTDRVLGISAMIGMLMLIGIVVTNAVVLIDRVQANLRERGMSVHDSLVEAGGRRLRPILMTAIATIMALLPLAIGLSKGAIIAAELGTVVIGGLFSSTLLTLLVVPVMYSLLAPLHKRLMGAFGRKETPSVSPQTQ